jgi:hypothetical protein
MQFAYPVLPASTVTLPPLITQLMSVMWATTVLKALQQQHLTLAQMGHTQPSPV